MITIKDISNACGLSVATVSRALNNQNEVNPKTAERVREIARQMGYYPNAAARALKTNRSYNIGVLYENLMDHEYFSLVIDKIRHTAETKGYDITFLSNAIGNSQLNYYEHAKYRGLDGIIILQGDFSAAQIRQLALSEFPCVSLDHKYDSCDCVSSDNREGIAQIVRKAYEAGHRRIAFIHGEVGSVTNARIDGFRKECESLAIDIPAEYIQSGCYHEPDSSRVITKKLMSLPVPPTCILFPDDYASFGGLNELEKIGYRVPEDISIIGYDGIRLAEKLRPHLTTYRQDYEKIGELAVMLLTDAIENPLHRPQTVTVTGSFLEGATLSAIAR